MVPGHRRDIPVYCREFADYHAEAEEAEKKQKGHALFSLAQNFSPLPARSTIQQAIIIWLITVQCIGNWPSLATSTYCWRLLWSIFLQGGYKFWDEIVSLRWRLLPWHDELLSNITLNSFYCQWQIEYYTKFCGGLSFRSKYSRLNSFIVRVFSFPILIWPCLFALNEAYTRNHF